MKSVQIRSFFWSVFSCIRTEYSLYSPYSEYSPYSPYSRSIRSISSIQSEYRKIRTRENSAFGHFSRIGKNLIRKSFLNYLCGSSLFKYPHDIFLAQKFDYVWSWSYNTMASDYHDQTSIFCERINPKFCIGVNLVQNTFVFFKLKYGS